jgi:hypothetical protein
MLASHALALVGVPMRRVIRVVQDAARRALRPAARLLPRRRRRHRRRALTARLHSVTLPVAAASVGRTLATRRCMPWASRWCRCGAPRAPSASPDEAWCWPPATRWCCRACPSHWRWPKANCWAAPRSLVTMKRRVVLAGIGLPWLGLPSAAGSEAASVVDAAAALRRGGVAVLLRHAATEPGIGDPPGFRLDDCSTQRNLSDEGRAQARRIGAWFSAASWCRRGCAPAPGAAASTPPQLAFGRAEPWAALGSPRAGTESSPTPVHWPSCARRWPKPACAAGFEVWVTHMFVLATWPGGHGHPAKACCSGCRRRRHGPRVLGRASVRRLSRGLPTTSSEP